MPFLENVTRGRNIPRERLLEVAEHYYHFGGVSPINAQVRELIAALRPELDGQGITLPIYWGNRNWHPMLADTIGRDDRARGQARSGDCSGGLQLLLELPSVPRRHRPRREPPSGAVPPQVDKVRVFYNHPEFIAANADRVSEALGTLSCGPPATVCTSPSPRTASRFRWRRTAIMSSRSVKTCRLVAAAAGIDRNRWTMAYQSRSGRPEDPWLGPDILDHLKDLKERGVKNVLVHPIGFLSDHLEVLYDLDFEAKALCARAGDRDVSKPHGRHASPLREDAAHAGPGAAGYDPADDKAIRRSIWPRP